jgi:excisionase family DNA binding protein
MRTLTLEQAAAFLNLHRVTVIQKVRAGIIPGAKPGKCWTFIEEDLTAYLRSLYPSHRQALEGDSQEKALCHFTNARAHRTGGSVSPTTDDAYSKALGLRTGTRPKSSTTS